MTAEHSPSRFFGRKQNSCFHKQQRSPSPVYSVHWLLEQMRQCCRQTGEEEDLVILQPEAKDLEGARHCHPLSLFLQLLFI